MYESKTYSALLQDALNEIRAGVQTGEGYLVYNAISALAYELEKIYIQLDYIMDQSHADTADLEELIEIAKDRGIYQKKATNAYVEIKGNTVIPIGTRFSLKSFNYRVMEAIGEYCKSNRQESRYYQEGIPASVTAYLCHQGA